MSELPNVAGVEVLAWVRQRLGGRRAPDVETLRRETKGQEKERNRLGASVERRFFTEDVYARLRSFSPSGEP